jgi:hypothetical protein
VGDEIPASARTHWMIYGERLVDENPHVHLSAASVEPADGNHFEEYVFALYLWRIIGHPSSR